MQSPSTPDTPDQPRQTRYTHDEPDHPRQPHIGVSTSPEPNDNPHRPRQPRPTRTTPYEVVDSPIWDCRQFILMRGHRRPYIGMPTRWGCRNTSRAFPGGKTLTWEIQAPGLQASEFCPGFWESHPRTTSFYLRENSQNVIVYVLSQDAPYVNFDA
jgi:hypothetical protein